MESVTLVGGPFDGRGINWRGGDQIQMELGRPVLDFSVPTTEPVRYSYALYRRSLVTRHLFVFQP